MFKLVQLYFPGSSAGKEYDINDDFETFFHYAKQIMISDEVDFKHELIHKLHSIIDVLIRTLLFKGDTHNIFAKLINSPLRPLINVRKNSISSFQPFIDSACSCGSKNGALMLINAHRTYGLERIDFYGGLPLKKTFIRDGESIDDSQKEVAEVFLVAGMPKSPDFDDCEKEVQGKAKQTYKVCKDWFSKMMVVTLKLMILRRYIYCTIDDEYERVRIPSYYPAPLYQWSTYRQEMEKNDAFNNRNRR
jgi:hypothetical protein